MSLPDGQPERLRNLWDKLSAGVFVQPEFRTIVVGGLAFRCLPLPRMPDQEPKVLVESGLSFLAWPRLSGYRYRWVLVPRRNVVEAQPQWEISALDVQEWITWANQMNHVVTYSTFKSGAGVPWSAHAQSVPLWLNEQTKATVLEDVAERILVEFRVMPFFDQIQIGVLEGHPARGILLTGSKEPDGAKQVAQKIFELALNYDHLKAFNLVIVPAQGSSARVYFFPRRRDGVSIFGPNRWQVSGMELCGMIPAKSQSEFENLSETTIRELFSVTIPDETEFEAFLHLVETF